ncbi:hypothetical protein PG988_000029 [Apiospora saccharicola]
MDPFPDDPAMEPPPGVVPNFAEPGGSHALGHGIVIASSIISAAAVLVRLVNSVATRKFLLEDALMIAALGPLAGTEYVMWDFATYPGFWVHQWNVPRKSLAHYLYYVHLLAAFYGPAMCIKVAILVNWLRTFVPAGQHNAHWWTLQVLIRANVVFYFVMTVSEIFRCWPPQKIWDIGYVGGSCAVNVEVQHLAISIFNFVSDAAILAMPQTIIWKLRMSRRQRWGLSLLFVIGVGIVRAVYFIKLLSTDDAVYYMSGVAIWTTWEIACGFLVLAIPAMPRASKAIPIPKSIAVFFRSLSSQRSGSEPPVPQYQLYQPRSRRRRDQDELREEYAFIIDGLTVADRLTEAFPDQVSFSPPLCPVNVLVVEYGDIEPTPGYFEPPGSPPQASNFSYTVPVPTLNNRSAGVRIGATVGGCSAINGQFFDRASRHDYDDWDRLAGDPLREDGSDGARWDWDALLPYFKKVR